MLVLFLFAIFLFLNKPSTSQILKKSLVLSIRTNLKLSFVDQSYVLVWRINISPLANLKA